MASTARRYVVGADGEFPLRAASLVAGLFLAAAVTAWGWWTLTGAYQPLIRDWLGLGTFAFHDLQIALAPGLLCLGCAAAGLHAYRGGGGLASVTLSVVAFEGYQVGAYLAGVIHGGGPIENLLRYGLTAGLFGFAVGVALAGGREPSDLDRPRSVSRRAAALVLTAAFVLGMLFFVPVLTAIA